MEHLETAEFREGNFTIIFCVFSVHNAFVLHFSSINFGTKLLYTILYTIYHTHTQIHHTHIIYHIIEGKALLSPSPTFQSTLFKTHRNCNSAYFSGDSENTQKAF